MLDEFTTLNGHKFKPADEFTSRRLNGNMGSKRTITIKPAEGPFFTGRDLINAIHKAAGLNRPRLVAVDGELCEGDE